MFEIFPSTTTNHLSEKNKKDAWISFLKEGGNFNVKKIKVKTEKYSPVK